MAETNEEFLVDGRYGILDLVDLEMLRDIFEKFTAATGFTIGFLDHPGLNILIATGWRDICTRFHRENPEAAEICRRSNARLLDGLKDPGQVTIDPCDHGLVDCATPIIIKGRHIASLATGQLLLAPADPERFRKQACRFGFDEEAYLKALAQVPVVSETRLRAVTRFLGSLAHVISDQGYANLELQRESDRLEREITTRRQVETALKESEARLKTIFEHAVDGILIADQETRKFTHCNPMICQMTGYAEAELSTLGLGDIHPPQDLPMVAEHFERQIRGEITLARDIPVRRKDGSILFTDVNSFPIVLEGRSCLVGFFRDITDRRQAETLRAKMEERLFHVQKLESLGLLAGGIAHDFNNLLTGILGNIDLALADLPAVSPIRENLMGINQAAHQAADLCRQMLAYSGRGRFVVQRLDLRAMVTELAPILTVTISKKVLLRQVFEGDVPPIDADPSQIRQVLMNLIINASESFGDEHGTITITVGARDCDADTFTGSVVRDALPEGRYSYVEVADDGCGMDPETRRRIFEPFFSTKFAGRGLGLAAVLGIVRGHRGAILLYSEKDKGTTFKVLFPVAEGEPAPPKTASSVGLDWKGSGTILLADDEPTVRDVGRKLLERLGFHVLLAVDGVDALRLFRETVVERHEKIDCVILDLTMPRMDGSAAFQQIRQLRPRVPVILSSGYNEQEVTQKFVGRSFTTFIQKPYQLLEMATRLREALTRQPAEGDT